MSSERYLFLIKGSLVMAQPLAAPETGELLTSLLQQGFAVGQQAVIFLPEYIPPGHLGIALTNEFARILQAGFPSECLVGKQVPSVLVPAEDIHG